ncbi:MAG: preprotein translocase subunit YajC [Lachnospiraceae bacterium]|nr:preprotein translocase subunit YajC [Lachnospiraceae bacterium]
MSNLLATSGEAMGGSGSWIIILYVVLIGAMMYFMIIRPQRRQRKEQAELMSSMAIGDNVMTTAGFYGVIIDMTDDTVIVEFGNNKNCRIPMQKQAIIQVEKPLENS